MCLQGTLIAVKLDKRREFMVDACIAEEICFLNVEGVETVGSCCGHGQAGKVIHHENGYGEWKEYGQPPIALIKNQGKARAIQLGYRPYPFYYADGVQSALLQVPLKTGCLTLDECVSFNRCLAIGSTNNSHYNRL